MWGLITSDLRSINKTLQLMAMKKSVGIYILSNSRITGRYFMTTSTAYEVNVNDDNSYVILHCPGISRVVSMRVIVHILIIMCTEYYRLYCNCFHCKLYYTCEIILWPLLACFPCIHLHAFTPCFHCMQVVSMRVIVHILIIMNVNL